MTDPDRSTGEPPSHIHIGPSHERRGGLPWWLWLLLGLLALALLALLMRGCERRTGADVTAAAPTGAPVVAATRTLTLPGGRTVAVQPGSTGERLGTFLGNSSGTVPASFALDKINFDTAKSDIRAADQGAIDEIATILNAYPNTQARLEGYADNRGSDPANQQLGKARADAVKAALVAKGVDGSRIATASGGEHDPVDTNATAGGRFENRRTELVITRR